jgi:hypothetical protein
MTASLTIECAVHFEQRRRGRKELAVGPAPAAPPGRVPRVARLLALAHRFAGLLRDGVARDYAALGRLGHVSRARISQIMSLLHLAPDLQEQVLFLPPTGRGRDRLQLRHLLPVAATADWPRQRRQWQALRTLLGR